MHRVNGIETRNPTRRPHNWVIEHRNGDLSFINSYGEAYLDAVRDAELATTVGLKVDLRLELK